MLPSYLAAFPFRLALSSAASFVGTALNTGQSADPIYSALAAYREVEKAYAAALARLAALERAHPDIWEPAVIALPMPKGYGTPDHEKLFEGAKADKSGQINSLFEFLAKYDTPQEQHRARLHAELQADQMKRRVSALNRHRGS